MTEKLEEVECYVLNSYHFEKRGVNPHFKVSIKYEEATSTQIGGVICPKYEDKKCSLREKDPEETSKLCIYSIGFKK